MPGMRIDLEVRDDALSMYRTGSRRCEIQKALNVSKSTLSYWIECERNGTLAPRESPRVLAEVEPAKGYRVSTIRKVLDALDEGVPIRVLCRDTGLNRGTIRRWRDQPKYREATYEYDDDFQYDINDLTDCGVVAQHLCNQTLDVVERWELMLTAAGYTFEVQDDNSSDFKPPYNKRGNKKPRSGR